MKAGLFLLAALLVSTMGYAQPLKVGVVPVESVDHFKSWLGTPVDAARAASPGSYPGRLAQLQSARKTQLPVVVSGLPSPAPREMRLVADVEILGSDGKSLGTSAGCCQATIPRGSRESAVVLSPWVNVEPDSNKPKGSFTVRVSVTDGTQWWNAAEVLPYGASDVPGSASEAPRLRMNLPPGQLEPGGPGDKRDCLALPTPAEVIRCSERK